MITHPYNKIDDYLAGKMNSDEMKSFEMEMERDPSIQMENDFHKELIDGLKTYRKYQLKARLDAIEIPTSFFNSVSQTSSITKIVGATMTTLAIGLVSYLSFAPDRDVIPIKGDIDQPNPIVENLSWNIEPAIIKNKKGIKSSAETIKEISTIDRQPNSNLETNESSQNDAFIASFDEPQHIKFEELDISSGLSKKESDYRKPTISNDELDLDIETKINKSKTIKYKFYDGKLFLEGDFNEDSYEILEINSSKGRKIYIKYRYTYYEVKITDKLTELPKVTNLDVLRELNILKRKR